MKELYVICFTIIIVTVLHLMINQMIRETFANCPPDTVQGSAYQSYNNPFKSRCFAGIPENDPNYGTNYEENYGEGGDSDVASSDNVCPYSSKENPYDSSKSNVKHWCNIPEF